MRRTLACESLLTARIHRVQISISDITALADRGKYVGGVGAVWGIASVLGPLIGGAIVDNTTWRYVKHAADLRRTWLMLLSQVDFLDQREAHVRPRSDL